MSEQLAIIKGVRVINDDRVGPCLTFTTYVSESLAAGQFLSWEDAGKVIETIGDLRKLEGAPCWVDVGGGMIKFVRMFTL